VDHFEILEHTADVGLQVQASSLEALFAQAAAGFYALALEDGLPRSPAEPARGSYAGDSWESALVHLLNELVFQLFTKNRGFGAGCSRPFESIGRASGLPFRRRC